jgi:rod shape-determining protein MreC
MLLTWIGLRPSGLKRSQSFFVFISRFINRPFISLPRALWSFALLIFSAYSFMNSLVEGRLSENLKSITMDVTAPLVAIPRTFSDMIHSVRLSMRSNAKLQEEIKTLQAEVELLKIQRARAEYLARENSHLRSILNVTNEFNHKLQRVKVLGVPFDHMRSSLIIAGSAETGISKNQAVTTIDGVIGRVTDMGSTAARVMLITDVNSRIPVRIESTGEQAILSGQNSDELIIIHKDHTKTADGGGIVQATIKVGDRLVTSGYGGIFPPDLPVAVVTSIVGDSIRATPLANPLTAQYVNIIEAPFIADAQ